jgi:alcohol dehydrogenase class IV
MTINVTLFAPNRQSTNPDGERIRKMNFKFSTVGQIIFGNGTVNQIGDLAADKGRRVFLVTGNDRQRADPVSKRLVQKGIRITQFGIKGEPTTDVALAAVAAARREACTFVVGVGGGSVLDTGKVVAALLTNCGDLMDYLEVIGQGRPLKTRPAPYIAVPTTAGTGAEVTRNAVLDSPQHHVKVSMRSRLMLPHLALIDPELTRSMPPHITAVTGLDAFTQLLEAFVSGHANPMTDAICREGLKRAGQSLERAFSDGNDMEARRDMSLASVFGGLALANAKLGAVHGFAGPLGGMYAAPHGALCATLLPHVMKNNLKALQARSPGSPAIKRYEEIAWIVTGNSSARAIDGIEWVRRLCSQLNVPCLSDYGIEKDDFSDIIAKSKNSSSMKGNPILLTGTELMAVLNEAL